MLEVLFHIIFRNEDLLCRSEGSIIWLLMLALFHGHPFEYMIIIGMQIWELSFSQVPPWGI